MTNDLKEATLSVRITRLDKEFLLASARRIGLKFGSLAARDISEGNRRRRFPAIDFRDGYPGRVGYLVGTRWPVWMIVDLVEELNGDLLNAAKHMDKPAALVKMAMDFAETYPSEVQASRQLSVRKSFEAMKEQIPGLEQL